MAKRYLRLLHKLAKLESIEPQKILDKITEETFSFFIHPTILMSWDEFSEWGNLDNDQDVIKFYESLKQQNLIKSIRPHFQKAVEGEIGELRKQENPNNFTISGMEQLRDFINTGIFDVTTYVKNLVFNSTLTAIESIMEGDEESTYKRDFLSVSRIKLSMFFMLAAANNEGPETEQVAFMDDMMNKASEAARKYAASVEEEIKNGKKLDKNFRRVPRMIANNLDGIIEFARGRITVIQEAEKLQQPELVL